MKKSSTIILLIIFSYHLPAFSCTIFSIKKNQKVYVGNNEDWYIPYAKYRVLKGEENTFGRIIFSYNDNWGQGGMNEKGLFFDWILNTSETNNWKNDPLKKDYKGNLSEKILAECSSVKEALTYFKEYNEPIFKISHIVLVDTSGHTAFVAWQENKINITDCKGLCAQGYGAKKAVDKYIEIDGGIDREKIKGLLDEAHQEGEFPTLYSNIYDLKEREIYLYNFHNYDEEVKINLAEALKLGEHSRELKDIFKTQIPRKEFRKLQRVYLLKELQNHSIKRMASSVGYSERINLHRKNGF